MEIVKSYGGKKKMDEETLQEIDKKLDTVEWHLGKLADMVEEIDFASKEAEQLIYQVRQILEKGGEK
jgi:hypothetical protein